MIYVYYSFASSDFICVIRHADYTILVHLTEQLVQLPLSINKFIQEYCLFLFSIKLIYIVK